MASNTINLKKGLYPCRFLSARIAELMVCKRREDLQLQSKNKHVDLPHPGASFTYYSSAHALPESWDELASKNIFLSRTYLQTLEDYPPQGMSFAYLQFLEENQPVGIAYFQLIPFEAKKSLQLGLEVENDSLIKNYKGKIKEKVAARLSFNLLVGGNLLLSGQHAAHFQSRNWSKPTIHQIRIDTIDHLKKIMKGEGRPVDGTMIKDLPSSEKKFFQYLEKRNFHEIEFQPSMVLPLRSHWHSFADYLADLSSKYRVRAKRAFKKGKTLTKKELSLSEIQANKEKLYALYLEVAKSADFNAVWLHADYFLELKKAFPETFHLTAYYLNDEIVGFHTLLENGDSLEAHFLGLEQDFNRRHQVYLNMLFDMIEEGIESGIKEVVFSRTALEIKSSIGAEPVHMYSYLKHQNEVFNHLVPLLINYLEPSIEWQPRHPFKTAS